MKKFLSHILFSAAALCLGSTAFGQGSSEYGSGIKLKLNDEGSKYVRFIMWNQTWFRYTQNNPGTAVNGSTANTSFDIGARRLRFLGFAQITPRYLILMHFGINNQTFISGGVPNGGETGNGGTDTRGKKPGIFFHDVWNEYAVIPNMKPGTKEANKFSLYAGAGLHYWNGVSRMTSASTLNFMAVDAPIFNWANIDEADQFARQMGLYLKGKAGKLDYRVSLNRTFSTKTPLPTSTDGKHLVLDKAVDYNAGLINPAIGAAGHIPDLKAGTYNGGKNLSYGGYFMYQFKDQESNLLPFTVGTYVGTKKVFNLGGGFYYSPKGTASASITGSDTLLNRHDVMQFGLDAFLDMPFGGDKNMAVTAYSVFYNYNFGPKYLRNTGIMNIGAKDASYTGTDASQAGYGNAAPLLGTGNIWYTQAGFLLPKTISKKMRLQPFVAYTMKSLEAIDGTMNFFDAGCNLFMDGHHSKFTLQYSNRPLIISNAPKGNRGEVILQAQVYL